MASSVLKHFTGLVEFLRGLEDFEVLSKDQKERYFSYERGILHVHELNKKIQDALTWSGITDYATQIFKTDLDLKGGDVAQLISSLNWPHYKTWYENEIAPMFLVPDTNVLIDRVLTRQILPRVGMENASKVRISRLTTLELEAHYRRGKQPLSRSGFCEVRELTVKGATFLTPLPWDIVLQYSKLFRQQAEHASGHHVTWHKPTGDPAIRREIVQDAQSRVSNIKPSDPIPVDTFVVTCDEAFALATFAEGIPVLCLKEKPVKDTPIKLEKMALLVHESAVIFRSVTIKAAEKMFTILGHWEGKNIWELMDCRLKKIEVTKKDIG